MLTLNNPETFLLRSSVALLVLWLVYVLFLQKETALQFRRYFLLGSSILLLSAAGFELELQRSIAPATVERYAYAYKLVQPELLQPPGKPEVRQQLQIQPEISYAAPAHPQKSGTTLRWPTVVELWLVGAAIAFVIFMLRLMRSWYSLTKLPKVLVQGQKVRIGQQACSFFNLIVLPASATAEEQAVMLQHERVHQQERHVYDLLLAECVQLLFWFHPLAYWYKTELKKLHEFLADRTAVSASVNYRRLLITHQLEQNGVLVHAFNSAFIIKRLSMLNAKVHKLSTAKRFGVLAAIALAGVLASCELKLEVKVDPQKLFASSRTTAKFSEADAEAVRAEMLAIIAEAKAADQLKYINVKGVFHDALLRNGWPADIDKRVTYSPESNLGSYYINNISVFNAEVLEAIKTLRYEQFMPSSPRLTTARFFGVDEVPFETDLSDIEVERAFVQIKSLYAQLELKKPIYKPVNIEDLFRSVELRTFEESKQQKKAFRERIELILSEFELDQIKLLPPGSLSVQGNSFKVNIRFIHGKNTYLDMDINFSRSRESQLAPGFYKVEDFQLYFLAQGPEGLILEPQVLKQKLNARPARTYDAVQQKLKAILLSEGFTDVQFFREPQQFLGEGTLTYKNGSLKHLVINTEEAPATPTVTYPPIWQKVYLQVEQPLSEKEVAELSKIFTQELNKFKPSTTKEGYIRQLETAAKASTNTLGLEYVQQVPSAQPEAVTLCFALSGNRSYVKLIY